MVKQIVRDIFFLGQPSEPATKADIQVGKDLQDTLHEKYPPHILWHQSRQGYPVLLRYSLQCFVARNMPA